MYEHIRMNSHDTLQNQGTIEYNFTGTHDRPHDHIHDPTNIVVVMVVHYDTNNNCLYVSFPNSQNIFHPNKIQYNLLINYYQN